MSAERGVLLHLYTRELNHQSTVCALGKLEGGETFAIHDDRLHARFFIRLEDEIRVRDFAGPEIDLEPATETTMDGAPTIRVSCPKQYRLRDLATVLVEAEIRTYEADLSLTWQYQMRWEIRTTVCIEGEHTRGTRVGRVYKNPAISASACDSRLSTLVLDIETDQRATTVYAVSFVLRAPGEESLERVHLVGHPNPADTEETRCHADEPALLRALAATVREWDPDILTGWNVIDFDFPVLQQRFQTHAIPFTIGRSEETARVREGRSWGGSRVVVPGRQVLDALHLVRATTERFEDYRLDTVARHILGRGKTLEAADDEDMAVRIERAYRDDRAAFSSYCLEDSRLVGDLLEKEEIIPLTLQRSMLTGLPLDRAWGSIPAFEFLYISELHRRGLVAPTLGVDRQRSGAPGGLVMSPEPGLYHQVFVFDFKSLYPSIIRTFNIDPLSFVRAEAGDPIRAPNGATFDREPAILPHLLSVFFEHRAQARAQGNQLASQTYKILMNSFYGVLATDACRFARGAIAGAITEFGHYLLRWARSLLEEAGCQVLYGDTDSLFVDAHLASSDDERVHHRGSELCRRVNEELQNHIQEKWHVESHLELEFEKLYRRLLLPPMRHGTGGRAKGYAGLLVSGEVEVVGMEAVRRDWTPMAHMLQRQLLALLFQDATAAAIETHVVRWIEALWRGEKDGDLVYRKNLRKPVDAYKRAVPPHVRAARLMKNPSGVIAYVMTVQGPQPVNHVSAELDYEHYIKTQIEPLLRTLAAVMPFDVDGAVKGVLDLFATAVAPTKV